VRWSLSYNKHETEPKEPYASVPFRRISRLSRLSSVVWFRWFAPSLVRDIPHGQIVSRNGNGRTNISPGCASTSVILSTDGGSPRTQEFTWAEESITQIWLVFLSMPKIQDLHTSKDWPTFSTIKVACMLPRGAGCAALRRTYMR